jgi:hypothetical protein
MVAFSRSENETENRAAKAPAEQVVKGRTIAASCWRSHAAGIGSRSCAAARGIVERTVEGVPGGRSSSLMTRRGRVPCQGAVADILLDAILITEEKSRPHAKRRFLNL